ncbi:MAG: amino acid ABC transporter substrate-binding protein [Alphaproteobacteria bacterium]|nr:amino acid ABC transporter substrate-binding protein [Alphaproteobacteria bacterium]
MVSRLWWRSKKQMKKVLLALVLALGLVACGEKTESPKENEKPVVKIGAIFPLSGATSTEANELKEAMQVIVSDLNDTANVKYELIFEDSVGGAAAKGVLAAQKLAQYDKVNIIYSIFSDVAKAIMPIVEQNEIVQIGVVANLPTFSGGLNFQNFALPEYEAERLLDYVQKQNIKNIVAFVNTMSGELARYNSFEKLAKEKDINVKKYEIVRGNRNFDIDIYKAMEDKPDAFLLILAMPELDILGKSLKNKGIDIPVLAMEAIAFSENKSLFENAVYTNINMKSEILNDIKKRANINGEMGLLQIYDSLSLINNIINKYVDEHKKIPSGQELAKLISDFREFKGTANIVEIKNNKFINKYVLQQIVNGQPVAVEE